VTDIANQVVWITGASSGIGEALAVAASRRGARLVLSARRASELERVRGLCATPADVAVLPLDLERFDAGAAAAQASAFFGAVDVLVNNAGMSQRSLVADTSMEVYRRLMELDFFAPVALTKAVLPGMLARRRGHVVAISSVAGKVATPLRSGYAAAKCALHGFYDAMRAEVWKQGIKVTVIVPGFIRTDVSINAVTGSGEPYGTMDGKQAQGMDPGVCADRVWRAVQAEKSEAMIGGFETLAAYLKRLSPALTERVIRHAQVT
jgi:short-subunit dehydrogenase